jgi:4-hydroxy-tetrahydrodipicolinate synthase
VDPSRLEGIIVPLATPLDADGRLDRPALERLLAHVISGGVSGVFILGTTGEGPHLDTRLRAELVRATCEICSSQVPVLVGLCDSSARNSESLAVEAAERGASALVLTPPFYYPLSQEELLGYLDGLVPRLPLQVFLYNIPSLTGIEFQPETVERAAAHLPIAGLKDSSGNMVYFAAVRRIVTPGPFRLFCGPEERLLEATLIGADGGVCGGANLFPRLYVELYEAAAQGRLDEARPLQDLILRISSAIYSRTDEATSYLRGLKCALRVMGLCREVFAEPLSPLPEPARKEIEEFLSGFEGTFERDWAACHK